MMRLHLHTAARRAHGNQPSEAAKRGGYASKYIHCTPMVDTHPIAHREQRLRCSLRSDSIASFKSDHGGKVTGRHG